MIRNVLTWIKGLFGLSADISQDSLVEWELLPYNFEIDWYVVDAKARRVVVVRKEAPDNYGGSA